MNSVHRVDNEYIDGGIFKQIEKKKKRNWTIYIERNPGKWQVIIMYIDIEYIILNKVSTNV